VYLAEEMASRRTVVSVVSRSVLWVGKMVELEKCAAVVAESVVFVAVVEIAAASAEAVIVADESVVAARDVAVVGLVATPWEIQQR
jgi:hypothetical protein